MNQKKFPVVLIIVIAMVVVALMLLMISFFSGTKNEKNKGNGEVVVPIIELNLNTTEDNQEKIVIEVIAKIEDDEGIEYIEFPDGNKVYSDKSEFEVTRNGKYEFKAVGKNGTESSLSIDVKNIREISSKNPYLPEGFEHISGEVDSGYIIQDKYGNQYVWVPVESGILTRTTLNNPEYQEYDSTSTGLVNSVAKNFGFYIARYEASAYQANGIKFAASMEGKNPFTNIVYKDAVELATNTAIALKYPEEITTSLPSSYAWDTVLSWIDKTIINYSSNTSYGNYSGTILPTGGTESDRINNVCDLAGNVREWTTEVYKESNLINDKSSQNNENVTNRVVRGGSTYINKVASSRNAYPDTFSDEYWGFRIILYKNS